MRRQPGPGPASRDDARERRRSWLVRAGLRYPADRVEPAPVGFQSRKGSGTVFVRRHQAVRGQQTLPNAHGPICPETAAVPVGLAARARRVLLPKKPLISLGPKTLAHRGRPRKDDLAFHTEKREISSTSGRSEEIPECRFGEWPLGTQMGPRAILPTLRSRQRCGRHSILNAMAFSCALSARTAQSWSAKTSGDWSGRSASEVSQQVTIRVLNKPVNFPP